MGGLGCPLGWAQKCVLTLSPFQTTNETQKKTLEQTNSNCPRPPAIRITIGLPQNDITTIASLVSHWLCYFNSAVNPLIYNLMSGKFRHEFANLFFCRWLRRATGPNAPNALN